MIPAQPPRGVATFQGDFLSPIVQKLVREFVGRTGQVKKSEVGEGEEPEKMSYIDTERHASEEGEASASVDVSIPLRPTYLVESVC